jgi:hypothetical protein
MSLHMAIIYVMSTSANIAVPVYSLAGVHLEDTPPRARAAILALGYQIKASNPSLTYSQRLLIERAKQAKAAIPKVNPAGIGSLSAVQGDQKVTIIFEDNDHGQRVVSRITYEGSDLAHPYPQALRNLTTRYGPPTKIRPQGAAWCAKSDASCDLGGIPDSDMIQVRAEGGFGGNITTIRAEIGDRIKRVWREAYMTELRRISRAKDAF